MNTGISLYPGLGQSCAENLAVLEDAASLGITRVFTSLHIPESNREVFALELQELLTAARRHHLDVIADISQETQALLQLPSLTPSALQAIGITTVRVDSGFEFRRIAGFSRVMNVQLNASTLKPSDIQALRDNQADFRHIDSLHNFYPRPHTGLSEAYMVSQTQWLHQTGIHVGWFVPSQCGRRLPLRAGLPTLEADRQRSVSLAAHHALALGADSVFIGDSAPSHQELEELAQAGRERRNTVVLRARLLCHSPLIQDLLEQPMTARPDQARDTVRAMESRQRANGHTIDADETAGQPLDYGDITIDNSGYGRYQGEVQIILNRQPGDQRTNRAAYVLPEDQFLIDYITPGRTFRLEFAR